MPPITWVTISRPRRHCSTHRCPRAGCLSAASSLTPPAGAGFIVLDVVQVVGETAGSPYSNLVQKGELRTYVVINGKRIDYLNRYIKTSNETSERIKIPIPRGLLKTRQEHASNRTDRHG